MMPPDGMERLAQSDSILLGAVGWPDVPDHVSLWGLLIPIRRGFDQYVNLRPCKLMPGVRTPLAGRTEADIDFYVVRENTEGEYSSVGGRMFEGTDREFVSQQSVLTRHGVDRILKYAFELARTRPKKHLTSATKSNGITFTMPYWDERFALMGKSYPDIRIDQYHIDILCAHFVQHPDWFDVVVGSNLFGDILSDLGPAVAGSIGIAPSANINPEGKFPSMFEPVHGSAPDIAGKFICNPIGQVWSAALMLEHLGEAAARTDHSRRDRDAAAGERTEDARHGRTGGHRRCRQGAGGDRGRVTSLFSRLFGHRAAEPAWIEVAELQRRLAGDGVLLVDVRQPEEFIAPPGHLPGAINVPLGSLAGWTGELAARRQSIVLVCKTDRRSARAAAELLAAGVSDVAVLRGGTDGWHAQGLALE